MINIRFGVRREAIGVIVDEGWLTLAWVRDITPKSKRFFKYNLKKAGAQQSKLQVLLLCQRPIHTHSTESLSQFLSSQIAHNFFSCRFFKSLQIPQWWSASPDLDESLYCVHFRLKWPARKQKQLTNNWGSLYLRQQGYNSHDWIWDDERHGEQRLLAAVQKEWLYRFLHPLQREGLAPHGVTPTQSLEQNGFAAFPYAGVWPQLHRCSQAIDLASRALQC